VLRRGRPDGPAALPEVTYLLRGLRPDPARLTGYQHLLGEPGTDVLPAGFVHVLTFPLGIALMTRADFPVPALGIVHLANRVEQVRPLRLGETLDVRTWTRDLRPHPRGTRFELVAEVRAEGEVAWHGVSTYLAPGIGADPAASSDRGPRIDPASLVPTALWHLDAGTGRRYAAVSGDVNPIHLSALSAKAFGFPRAIAHGMHTAARLLAGVGAARGDAFTWEVAFAAPVLLPSRPVARVARADDGFDVALWDAKRGKVHVTGSVRPIV
jgi:acyl dehydratase